MIVNNETMVLYKIMLQRYLLSKKCQPGGVLAWVKQDTNHAVMQRAQQLHTDVHDHYPRTVVPYTTTRHVLGVANYATLGLVT